MHETVDLSTVGKDHLVFIDQVIGPQRLRTVSAVGETFPLYCTANGKAYLAQLSEQAVETLIGRVYEPRTPRTHHAYSMRCWRNLNPRAATASPSTARSIPLGICAAGVALQDPLGNAVAISVPVPTPALREPAGADRRTAARHQTRHGDAYEFRRGLIAAAAKIDVT